MIVGERILEISGTKDTSAKMKGLAINIAINDVKVKEENVEIEYSYTANYEEKLGKVSIKGILLAKEDKKLCKDIESEWKKNKKIPGDYAETILRAINYSGSANGTLLARVLNLTAPLIPPRIQLKKKK